MSNLIQAGRELIKGNFDLAVKTLSLPLVLSVYRGDNPLPQSSSWHFWSPGFQNEYCFTYGGQNSSWEAYKRCSPLSSIINRKTRADLTGKRWVMNNKGKEAVTEPANKIRSLLRRPNILQNQSQFFAQFKIYMELYDYCIVFCQPPAGFDRVDATSMWLLPPQNLKIKTRTAPLYKSKSIQDIIESVVFVANGNEYPLDLDFLFFFSTGSPSEGGIIPTNKIQLLSDPISNIISAMNSRGTLIRRRGALGIISPRGKDGTGAITVPLKPAEKEELQKEWRRYGTQSDQNNVVISNASIDWTRITMDVGELKLMEEVVDSSKMICDGYGYPPHLLGLIDPTFNNQNAAEKGLYQNTIITERQAYDDQWNEFFNTQQYRINITTDYSHLPVLQEDKNAAATARKTLGEELEREFKLNLITYNRFLELLDEDTVPELDGKYYKDLVALGWQFGNVQTIQNANTGNPPAAA